MSHVVDAAEWRYVDNGWPDDSLLACLRKVTDFPLFRPAAEGVDHEFLDASHVIDIHRLSEDLRDVPAHISACPINNLDQHLPGRWRVSTIVGPDPHNEAFR